MSDLWKGHTRQRFSPAIGSGGVAVHGVTFHGRSTHVPMRHPHWRQDCFGLVYLVAGDGFFEGAAAPYRRLVPGDLVLCFPELWHNYGPVEGGTWLEYSCFFSGPVIETLRAQRLLDHRHPVWQVGARSLVEDFHACLRAGEQGCAHALASAVFALISHAIVLVHPHRPGSGQVPPLLLETIEEICQDPGREWNFHEVASQLGLRYDAFRTAFRRHFALAPGAFLQRERIHRACQLLGEGRGVAETGDLVGMHDPFHFSRTFKAVVGLSPRAFAKRQVGG